MTASSLPVPAFRSSLLVLLLATCATSLTLAGCVESNALGDTDIVGDTAATDTSADDTSTDTSTDTGTDTATPDDDDGDDDDTGTTNDDDDDTATVGPAPALGDRDGLFPLFAEPQTDADRDLAPYTLSAPVEIARDELGMAHITATTETDIAFATGYAMAKDRLLQMDLQRRLASGRLAEVFGRERLANDIFYRNFGYYRYGRDVWATLQKTNPKVAALTAAYSNGVNRYIADAKAKRNGAKLEPGYAFADFEPYPWHPIDSFALAELLTFGLTGNFEGELITSIGITQGENGGKLVKGDAIADLAQCKPLEQVATLQGFDFTLEETEAELRERLGANLPENDTDTDAESAAARDSSTDSISDAAREQGRAQIEKLLKDLDAGAASPWRESPWFNGGSNSWVVRPNVMKNGGALIANDTHLTFQTPTTWYPLHYRTRDGSVDVLGVAFAGTPFVLLGQNGKVAWSATTFLADVTDVYELDLTDDGKGYVIPSTGEEVALQSFVEEIKVRKSDAPFGDNTIETFEWKRSPVHGHVLSSRGSEIFGLLFPPGKNKAMSVRWAGFGYGDEATSFYNLTQLQSCDEAAMLTALKEYSAGGQNFSCIDAQGNVGWVARTFLPIRRSLDPTQPPTRLMPPERQHDWIGFKPDSFMPRYFIAKGDDASLPAYITTSNNDPVGYTFDNDITNDEQYLACLYDPGVRHYALREALDPLTQRGDITLEEIQALQTDTRSRLLERFHNAVRPILESVGTNPRYDAFKDDARIADVIEQLELLKTTGFRTDTDDTGPSILAYWMTTFSITHLREKFGLTLLYDQVSTRAAFIARVLVQVVEGGDDLPVGGLKVADLDLALLETLIKTLDAMAERSGEPDPAKWAWGDFHVIRRRVATVNAQQLGPDWALPDSPAPGFTSTINVVETDAAPGPTPGLPPEALVGTLGPGMRHISHFDASGKIKTFNVFPGGVSGHPDSPHFDDQMDDFLAGRYFEMAYYPDDVEARTVKTETLDP